MIFDIAIGVIIGLICGLIPGLHPNTVIGIVQFLNFGGAAPYIYPSYLIFSIISSMVFFVINPITGLAFYPSARMYMRGMSKEAVLIVVFSSIISFTIVYFFVPSDVVVFVFDLMKHFIKPIVALVVLVVLIRSKNRLPFVLFSLLSFVVAVIAFNITSNFILPMFSGFFALPAILLKGFAYNKDIGKTFLSIKGGIALHSLKRGGIWRILLTSIVGAAIGVFISMFSVSLPTIGSPAVMLSLSSIFIPFDDALFLSSTYGFSVAQLYNAIQFKSETGKPRLGVLMCVDISPLNVFVAITISSILLLILFNKLLSIARALRFHSYTATLPIVISVLFYSGVMGVVVLLLSTIVGIACRKSGVSGVSLLLSLPLMYLFVL